MGRDDDSDDDRRRRKTKSSRSNNTDRRRSKKIKKKKREREYSSSSSHSNGDDDDDDDDDDVSSEDNHPRHKKHKKRRKQYSDDDDDNDSQEDDYKSRHHKPKDSKKKKKKKSKKVSRKDKTKVSSVRTHDPLQRNHLFAKALYELLEDHPALSADLPIMLIRMAGGASFDLSQMSDIGAAQGIEKVFDSLQPYGVERVGTSWTWKAPGGGGNGGGNHELILVKIARTLLDQIGVTMEAVNNYGRKKHQDEVIPPPDNKEVQKGTFSYTALQKQTFSLLDRFLQKDITLSNQLGELCNMILSGECVALDGLPDQSLREALEQLFRGAGLGRSEMDAADEDDEDEGGVTIGYGIPETNGQFARANMEHILEACRHRAAMSQEAPKRVMRGPLPRHMADQYASREEHDDDDDDDEGPAPIGMSKTRGDVPSKEDIAAMAELRRQELEGLVSGNAASTKPGEREEWMINPGEHDLLQNIKSGGMKNRNFENKKVRELSVTISEGPVDPTMQAEVDAIVQAHRDARGPSLMDQHREAKAAEKAAHATKAGKSFNWSRDGDLDAGRRVDKDHLRLLMGGAGGELNEKFQGGFSKT